MELTRSGESDLHAPPIVTEDLRPHATFKLQSRTHWNSNDLSDNEIAEVETNPQYITSLKRKLSQTRVIDDKKAVGAPASPLGFSQLQPSDYEDHPVVKICRFYWGQNELLANLKPGETIVITAYNLTQTENTLYFFEQYRYMQKRIDHLYGLNRGKKLSYLERNKVPFYANASVVVGGTPGIGEKGPTSYIDLTAFVGKSIFLLFYLAWLSSQKKKVLYWAQDRLHLFVGKDEIYYSKDQNVHISHQHWDAICLIDSDVDYTPRTLTSNRNLFVVQAASPNPKHIQWMKQRPEALLFILNPPKLSEVIAASVSCSLFLYPLMTLIVSDYIQS